MMDMACLVKVHENLTAGDDLATVPASDYDLEIADMTFVYPASAAAVDDVVAAVVAAAISVSVVVAAAGQ